MFASRSKPLAGLDITTSSIKLVELVPSGRSYRVECYAAEPSPPNSITEKSIVDADAVGEAVDACSCCCHVDVVMFRRGRAALWLALSALLDKVEGWEWQVVYLPAQLCLACLEQ